jgi:Sugar-transfer associated ATP-grasp
VEQQHSQLSLSPVQWPLLRIAPLFFCLAFVGLVALIQLAVPALEVETFSPMNVLLACAVGFGLINATKRLVLDRETPRDMLYWLVAVAAMLAIAAAELIDVGMDEVDAFLHLGSRDNVPELILLAIGAVSLVLTPFLVGGSRIFAIGLLALSGFGFVSGLPEAFSSGPAFAFGLSEPVFDMIAQVAGLLCLGLFVATTFVRSGPSRTTWEGTAALSGPSPQADGAFVGTRSRQMFLSGGIALSPRHPPLAVAFRPGFQDVTFYLVMIGMLVWAGRSIKRGTGKGYAVQASDMIRLWFHHRIDPPTYYAMDLYRPENVNWFPHVLTRFETKNGLFSTLNRHRLNPRVGHEMNDKKLFAQACAEAGIPHPQPLMIVDENGVQPQVPIELLEQDLFCKPRKTMGAKDTLTFKWCGNGKYVDQVGQKLDIFGVCAAVALKRKPMLVQPWLHNHQDIAGFAKDSLVAIRVITVLNEEDVPEVTLAMTRLLSKLEPDWQHLPDGEYASPINLETGEMGLFTGDNFKTALVRMTHHPVTGVVIKGRVLENWPAVRDLALKAHRVFKHRVIVGWDIALTPDGPMVLEGNTNLDVMFLQRVHDCPAGDTRFGELLNYQIQEFYEARKAA